jgi:hypothetical protein
VNFERASGDVAVAGGGCENCDGPLPDARPNRRYCSPNCRKRRWEREQYRKPCYDCRTPIDAHGERCIDCERASRAARHETVLATIARMYNAGVPLRKIAELIGRRPPGIGEEIDQLRRAGRIGYRYVISDRKRIA